VGLVARGARRARSRWATLDVGVGMSFRARGAAPGGLEVLADAEVLDARLRVRSRLETLALAAYACEVSQGFAREGEPEPRLYGLLETLLVLLEALDGPPAVALRLAFEAKLLTFAGVAPVLTRCAACGRALEEPLAFLPSGVHHASCVRAEDIAPLRVPLAWAETLEGLRRTPLREVVDLPTPEGPIEALSSAIAAHLGRVPVTRAFLNGWIQAP
jgi:DNA repair protein RecO